MNVFIGHLPSSFIHTMIHYSHSGEKENHSFNGRYMLISPIYRCCITHSWVNRCVTKGGERKFRIRRINGRTKISNLNQTMTSVFASIKSIRQLNKGCHTVQFAIEYEEMYFNTVMQELL